MTDSGAEDKGEEASLIKDARLLMEMGRLDAAEGKLQQVLREDPKNRDAIYYDKLIKERRAHQELRKRENGPIMAIAEGPWWPAWRPDPHENQLAHRWDGTNHIYYQSAKKQALVRKLEDITVEKFAVLEGLELSEVIKRCGKDCPGEGPG